MSGSDDLHRVTPRISDEDAERLLSGAPAMDDSAQVADLSSHLHALRSPADSSELTGLSTALGAYTAAVVTARPDSPTRRTSSMKKKRLTAKALATVAAVTFVSAGAAAAAGVVPTPFSAPRPSVTDSTDATDDDATEDTAADTTAVTTAASPETEATEATEATDPAEADDAEAARSLDVEGEDADGQGPDVNGPAKFGLCTAFAARTKHDDTTTTEAGATPPAEPTAEGDDSRLPVPFQNLTRCSRRSRSECRRVLCRRETGRRQRALRENRPRTLPPRHRASRTTTHRLQRPASPAEVTAIPGKPMVSLGGHIHDRARIWYRQHRSGS